MHNCDTYIGPCLAAKLYKLLIVDTGQSGHGVPHYHDGQVALLIPGPQQILLQHRGNTQCGMWNRCYLNTPLNMLTTPQEGATAWVPGFVKHCGVVCKPYLSHFLFITLL